VTPSFSLGRIAGIRIGLHWSWLVVLGLMIWTLSETVFPRQNPGLSEWDYRGMAVAAAVLLFVSVLLHELGHAFQARREGIAIEGITLWLFGGVASFRGMFPGPGAEFRVAIAGPLVSLALGALFAGFAALADPPVTVDGVAFWLGYINLSLLVFNLLPALPLDGGRILRAVLWRIRRDFAWATRIAAEAGRATGLLLVAAGVVLFLLGGMLGGAWLAFIGWFVLSAAGSEARYAEARQAISGLRVRDLMAPEPVSARRDSTLGEFMDSIGPETRSTSYPVLDDGRVVGLLPIWTVAELPRAEWAKRSVGETMVGLEGAPVLTPDDDLYEALSRLAEAGVGRGLVLEGDRLAGSLAVADVGRVLETRR
jgi:Zn-dependent protease/CBS domain-containing protein